MKKEDLTGQIFGDLKVLEFSRNTRKWDKVFRLWNCLCVCGRIKELTTSQLKSGHTRSCGCLLLKYRSLNARKENGYCALTQLYCAYRLDAKRRKRIFSLTREEFQSLTSQNCNYCGIIPSSIKGKNLKSGSYTYNGIDRVDNAKDYTIENCVTCCETCNRAKLEMSKKDFLNWIERVYNVNF